MLSGSRQRPNAGNIGFAILGTFAAVGLLLACALPSRAGDTIIESRESTYNSIYVHRRGPFVTMIFGHNRRLYTESIFDTRDELALPVEYTRYMTVGLAYVAKPQSVLEIGFGGGRTAWYLHKSIPELEITAVELDPVVYELAKKHFAVRQEDNFDIKVADGRRFLKNTRKSWDMIMIDAYRGPFVPFHLLTQEFYKEVKSHLVAGGVVVQNVEPTTMMFDSALRTVGAVFKNVDVYDAGGNVVVVAYDGDGKTQSQLLQQARALTKKFGLRYDLAKMVGERRVVTKLPRVDLLTDDFAPVEALLAIERHNRKLDAFSQKQ